MGRCFQAEAVYRAVCELLAETGYDRLTMDAVAARAQASKATLYRHWTGKADLVAQAVKGRPHDEPGLPDTGNLRDDVRGLLAAFRHKITSRDGAIFLGVLKAMHQDPDLAAVMRERMQAHWAPIHRELARRAVERGEIDPATDPALPLSAAVAEMSHRSMMRGEDLTDDHIDRLVDEVVLPSLTRRSGRS